MSEEKYTFKLKKKLLSSEIEELKAKRRKGFIKFLLGFLVACFCFGLGYYVSGVTNSFLYTSQHSKFDKIMTILSENWLYKNDYEDIQTELENKAYEGMTSFENDPYTTYMSEEELNELSSSINQVLPGGIGASYLANANQAIILEIYNDTPANKAQIKPGDIIYKVNGQKVEGEILENLSSYVGGQKGTKVNITLLRENKEVEVECVRESLDTSFYGTRFSDYLYLDINSFGDGTYDSMYSFIKKNSDLKKVIIDLRDNTGGYQDAASKICGAFIGPNKVYMNEYFADNQKREDLTPKTSEQFLFDKIIILTNSNTASAAEVSAICLKEQLDNVTLVGEKTFGKGVAQYSYLIEDGSALKYTVSYWTSPNDTKIHGIGIMPDVEIRNHEATYLGYISMNEEDVVEFDSVSSIALHTEYLLDFLGYDIDRYDGYFNQKLMDAIRLFQKEHNLEETGKLDFITYRSIYCAYAYSNGTDLTKDLQLAKAIELIEG